MADNGIAAVYEFFTRGRPLQWKSAALSRVVIVAEAKSPSASNAQTETLMQQYIALLIETRTVTAVIVSSLPRNGLSFLRV